MSLLWVSVPLFSLSCGRSGGAGPAACSSPTHSQVQCACGTEHRVLNKPSSPLEGGGGLKG